MQMELILAIAAVALGVWLLAPHKMHKDIVDMLPLNLSHEMHMIIGAALAIGGLWQLNQKYKLIKL